MDFHHLKVFVAAARHLNYTRAGQELRLRQPTISAHIRQLEIELGLELFEQVGKRLTLTEAGRWLEPVARRALQALEEVRAAVDEYQELGRGTLHLGASTTTGLYILPRLMARFYRMYPHVELRTTLANTGQIEQMVLNAEVDFGFVGRPPVAGQLASRPWLEDRIVLIAAPDFLPIARRKVTIRSLTGETLIQREAGSATRAVVEGELARLGCEFNRVIELGHPEAIKQAVINGLGIAFISRFAVEREVKAGHLAILPVKDLTPRRQLQICYRRGKHLSKADQALIAEAEKM